MKRYISVFEMITRSSIYKVLLIVTGMVVVESVFFYLSFANQQILSIEECIDESYYKVIFKIAYLLVTIAIVLPGMNLGSIQSYTLQRLRIKESRIFLLQAIYNMFAYMILWGTQLLTILLNFLIFLKNLPEGAEMSNQTLFLAFYRNDFMHTILPLEDGPGWWMLVLAGVTTAISAATFTKLQRSGKFGFELLLLVAAVLIYFPRAMGYDLAFILVTYVAIYCVIGMRVANKYLGGDEA